MSSREAEQGGRAGRRVASQDQHGGQMPETVGRLAASRKGCVNISSLVIEL